MKYHDAAAFRQALERRLKDRVDGTALQETMKILDGTTSSRVAALTGLSAERLAELGGVREQ